MIPRLASLLFARRRVVVFSRELDPSREDKPPDGYTFTDLTARDFRNCALAAERGRLPRFDERLSNGYRSVGFRDAEGRVVSYVWIACGDAGPSSVLIWRDVRVSLQRRDVFFWDCRTDPAHVRRGLYHRAFSSRALGSPVGEAGVPSSKPTSTMPDPVEASLAPDYCRPKN